MIFNRTVFVKAFLATAPLWIFWNNYGRFSISIFAVMFLFFTTLGIYGLFRTIFPNPLLALSLIIWIGCWGQIIYDLTRLEPFWIMNLFLLLPHRAVVNPAAKNFFLEMIALAFIYLILSCGFLILGWIPEPARPTGLLLIAAVFSGFLKAGKKASKDSVFHE